MNEKEDDFFLEEGISLSDAMANAEIIRHPSGVCDVYLKGKDYPRFKVSNVNGNGKPDFEVLELALLTYNRRF